MNPRPGPESGTVPRPRESPRSVLQPTPEALHMRSNKLVNFFTFKKEEKQYAVHITLPRSDRAAAAALEDQTRRPPSKFRTCR